MKYVMILIINVILTNILFGQVSGQDSVAYSGNQFGAEVDMLPYITGGYYASAWVGISDLNLRIRPVVARVDVPDFALKEGFNRNRLTAVALIADYFPQGTFEGIWIGTGIELWNGKVESDAGVSADYTNWQYTLGGGYVWRIYKGFYVNPWGALHLRIAGDHEVQTGSTMYRHDAVTYEVSLKFGWQFR